MKTIIITLLMVVNSVFTTRAQTASNDADSSPIGGTDCSGYGSGALANNSGNDNTAIGKSALNTNASSGNHNTGCGKQALFTTNEYENTGVGYRALYSSATSGARNTAMGNESLLNNTSGSYNTAIGFNSMTSITTGNENTGLGAYSDGGAGFSNQIAIGYLAINNGSNRVRLGTSTTNLIQGQPTALTITSDKRFKENIKDDVKGLEFILRLKPVSYNLDTRKITEFEAQGLRPDVRTRLLNEPFEYSTKIRRSGFLAQEVLQAAKSIGYDFDGIHIPGSENDIYGLTYDLFVMPLIKAIQEQQRELKDLAQTLSDREKALVVNENNIALRSSMRWTCTDNTVTLTFDRVSASENVRLIVCSLIGRTIREIAASEPSRFVFNKSELESGLYRAFLIEDDEIINEINFSVTSK
jgi:trimeric autotransporter adhesin